MGFKCEIETMPHSPKEATSSLAEIVISKIFPLALRIRNTFLKYEGALCEEDLSKLKDVYTLCLSQIQKTLKTLFQVFRTEYRELILLQETRQSTLERLSWCVNRLHTIEEHLVNSQDNTKSQDLSNSSILTTPMYFVNWIDHTFEILSKLASTVYQTDHRQSEDLCDTWKNEVTDCVTSLHISVDELLLSAMTLCKYCLPNDQLMIKARCQVVLRESKALLSELIDGDLEAAYRATPELLKLPVMPSNINILIDVLKDVLYVLETNTNTALLALLIHCFSGGISPVDVLKKHFWKSKGSCSCDITNDSDEVDNCPFVMDFDLYNERLLQIGSFAVSCSSDNNRIINLRSGLATLEALDPHLVPALTLSPQSYHAILLVDSWKKEVQEIRDSVFLIVDPMAFAEKSKQLMHQTLLEIMKLNTYKNSLVCQVINVGGVVNDLFNTYMRYEPDALTQRDKLLPLLDDLNSAHTECKIVSNLLATSNDFFYEVKNVSVKTVSFEQLIKRLRLLYSIVNRINMLFRPKEAEEHIFGTEEELPLKNVTQTIVKNHNTYVNSPRKPVNASRSIFARTTNLRSNTNNFPLSKLTKHLQVKKRDELSFSLKIDELFNLSEVNCPERAAIKQLESVRERSILYNFSPNKRSSLRKAVLSRRCKMPLETEYVSNVAETTTFSEQGDLMEEATSLQITEILNQMSDMTNTFVRKTYINTSTATEKFDNYHSSNVLRINVNSTDTISRHMWSIPVNASTVELLLDDTAGTMASNVTVPSNVTTLERISDIDLVESRLNSLKALNVETTL